MKWLLETLNGNLEQRIQIDFRPLQKEFEDKLGIIAMDKFILAPDVDAAAAVLTLSSLKFQDRAALFERIIESSSTGKACPAMEDKLWLLNQNKYFGLPLFGFKFQNDIEKNASTKKIHFKLF
jgi:hypothetical protein